MKKHSTLVTFLGFNNPGLLTYNGVDPWDEVQILDPVSQVGTPYAFVSAEDWGDSVNYPDGVWINVVTSEPANQTIIEPGTAVAIKRVGTEDISFISSGTVKTTKTQIDIYPGFNYVGVPKAANGTLGNLNFAPQLHQYDGVNTDYDELQKVNPDQTGTPFAAVEDDGPVMWNIVLGDYATNEPFQEGTGILLKRVGHPSSVITLEGTVIAP